MFPDGMIPDAHYSGSAAAGLYSGGDQIFLRAHWSCQKQQHCGHCSFRILSPGRSESEIPAGDGGIKTSRLIITNYPRTAWKKWMLSITPKT